MYAVANPGTVPQALMHNIKHYQVLHEQNLIMTVKFEEVPKVPQAERVQVTPLVKGFWRVQVNYGFMNTPDIPKALEESALVDGCTRWQVLWKVVFPMCRAGLFATAIFTFVFAWNDFIFALVLTRTEVTTYTVQVTHYFGGQSNFWAKIAAMSMLGTIPVFIAVATMQRYLVRGISMGAVKG